MDGIYKEVICCFCGNSLEIDLAVLLLMYPNINAEETQQFYCHKNCLNERLHESIPRDLD